MKTSKITLGLFILITFISLNGFVTNVFAQKCATTVKNIYFVDSGKTVTEVHPGSNGGNGYQLNIMGTAVDKFELLPERYMPSVNVIPGYTNDTSAKWSVVFAGNKERKISSVRMKNTCTGESDSYKLDSPVTLLSQ